MWGEVWFRWLVASLIRDEPNRSGDVSAPHGHISVLPPLSKTLTSASRSNRKIMCSPWPTNFLVIAPRREVDQRLPVCIADISILFLNQTVWPPRDLIMISSLGARFSGPSLT
jgi:hypothetical protein